jgi:hypothetical protein
LQETTTTTEQIGHQPRAMPATGADDRDRGARAAGRQEGTHAPSILPKAIKKEALVACSSCPRCKKKKTPSLSCFGVARARPCAARPPGRLRWRSDKALRDFLARLECLLPCLSSSWPCVCCIQHIHTYIQNLFIFPETQASATHLQSSIGMENGMTNRQHRTVLTLCVDVRQARQCLCMHVYYCPPRHDTKCKEGLDHRC